MVKLFERARRVHNSDELVVTTAKRMGRELYADLEPEARKEKLDSIVSHFRWEISKKFVAFNPS